MPAGRGLGAAREGESLKVLVGLSGFHMKFGSSFVGFAFFETVRVCFRKRTDRNKDAEFDCVMQRKTERGERAGRR